MSDKPVASQNSPYVADVEAGKSYLWCACGRSKTQPFCDGSHIGTSFSPVVYKAEKTQSIFFCGCRKSKHKPFCDGSHASS